LLASPSDVFVTLVPFLILIAAGLFAFGDRVRMRLLTRLGSDSGNVAIYCLLFASSVYGGYFGAGLGIILLAVAQLMGYSDFNIANSIKNFLATSFTVVSIAVFGIGGLIAWPQAVVMMVGSTVGGYAGGRLAKRVNSDYLRVFVIVFALALAVVYFFRAFG